MLDIDKIYNSNSCGQFKVIEYINAKNVIVEFLATGYKTKVQSGMVSFGSIKDKLHPTVSGVGFLGEGEYKSRSKGKKNNYYETWRAMLKRCYDTKTQERQPTYNGCTVTPSWHNLQNFAKWFVEQDTNGLQLDKDILIGGNKVYSPDTCIFVSHAKNTIKAKAKRFTFTSPTGDVIEIYNLKDFCRKNNLHDGAMNLVYQNMQTNHKGWRKT